MFSYLVGVAPKHCFYRIFPTLGASSSLKKNPKVKQATWATNRCLRKNKEALSTHPPGKSPQPSAGGTFVQPLLESSFSTTSRLSRLDPVCRPGCDTSVCSRIEFWSFNGPQSSLRSSIGGARGGTSLSCSSTMTAPEKTKKTTHSLPQPILLVDCKPK